MVCESIFGFASSFSPRNGTVLLSFQPAPQQKPQATPSPAPPPESPPVPPDWQVVPPVKPPPATASPQQAIDHVLAELQRFIGAVQQFQGSDSKSRVYRYIDEMLTRLMLSLDRVETDDESVRTHRLVFILSQLSISLFVCISASLSVRWSASNSRFESPVHGVLYSQQ